MKVVEEKFRQLLQKALCLWCKQIFVYIDDFALNQIRPKFLSLLMTGIVRIGDLQGFQKIFGSGAYSRSSKAVYNIKLQLTYSEFAEHMQNQLKQAHL